MAIIKSDSALPPHIDVVMREVHEARRIDELDKAIKACIDNMLEINLGWVMERNELVERKSSNRP